MQLVYTFVSVTALLANTIVANDYMPPPAVTSCATLTTTKPAAECVTKLFDCAVPACLAVETLTQSCGCNSIPTTSVCPTACQLGGCASTQYVYQIQDCFPTAKPTPSGSPTGYSNTTRTTTTTTTLTSCPAYKTCTGQTTTITSTENCPRGTCVCVYPTVSYSTTVLPGGSTSYAVPTPSTTAPPMPPTSKPTSKPTPTPIETNDAVEAGWGVGAVMGALGGLFIAGLGLL